MRKNTAKRALALCLAASLAFPGSIVPGNAVQAEETTDSSPMRIWFDEPVSRGMTNGGTDENEYWQQLSLPIGNSYMGANVYGEISNEHLTFNHKTLWNGGPSEDRPDYNGGNLETTDDGTPMYEVYQRINELLLAGKDEEASALCDKLVGSDDYGAYQSWGDIYLNFQGIDEGQVSAYSRDLNLEEAVANVDFKVGETAYHREYFISYVNDVLAMKLTADRGTELNFDVSFPVDNADGVTDSGLGKEASYTADGDTLVMSGELQDNQMKMSSMLKVVAGDGEVTANSDGESLHVSGTDEVVIFVAADTDYANSYPDYRTGESAEELEESVAQRVEKAVSDTYETVKEEHIADYRNIYQRVHLDLGQDVSDKTTDSLLEAYKNGTATQEERAQLEVLLYQYGRFLLIESSRAGDLPANLQGVWQNRVGTMDSVPWACDYHFNVNLQMNYWPAYSANMAECAEPLIDYVNSLREPGRVTAEIYFGIPNEEGEENGFTVHTMNNPFGWTAPGWVFTWGWSPAGLPWALQNCWEYFEYSNDMEYMKEHIYPMLKEEAKMYAGLLIDSGVPITLEDGTKSTRLVSSPAFSPEHGPKTLGNVYEQTLIWQLFEDAIQAMKLVNDPEDAKLIRELERKQARLAPIEIGDSGQIKEWYHETTLGSVGERQHRHMSHLLGLFPGDLISVENDTYMEAAIVSLEDRGMESTGWGIGQRLNAWTRTGNGNKAYQLIEKLFQSGIYANLWDAHPPFQIDGNLGYTSGVNEMLMQSNMGYINILPALPDAWESGSVEGIVARGNFETDIRWEEGAAEEVRILSRSGGNCAVNYTGISRAEVKDSAGKAVEFETLGRDRIQFDTVKGETYTITAFPEIASGPENLQAVRESEEGVKLSWDAVEGASAYQVYRKKDGVREKINQEPVTGNTYLDTEAYENPEEVKYLVTAVWEDGSESLDSQEAAVQDLTAKGMVDDGSARIRYTPESDWKSYFDSAHYGGGIHYKENTEAGDAIELTFTGTGFRVIAPKNRDRGIMDVYVDGEKDGSIDFYVDGDQKGQTVYEKTGLMDGRHTVRLVSTGEKNSASWNTKIELDAFQILGNTVSVSFESEREGNGSLPQARETLEGDSLLLPECALEIAGYCFAGWSDGKDIYAAGSAYIIPDGGAVLTAEWEKTDSKIPSEQLTAIADSEENSGNDGPASWAVDGNEDNWWHTRYSSGETHPDIPNNANNSITIDLGGLYQVDKLEYVTRWQSNGRILEYQLLYSTSENGDDFTEIEGGKGKWENNDSRKEVTFVPVNARRIQLRALKTAADNEGQENTYISANEIYIYHTGAEVTEPDKMDEIVLSPELLDLNVGESITLEKDVTATVVPQNASLSDVTWRTGNSEIAVIRGGVLTAVAEGETVLIAESRSDSSVRAEIPLLVYGTGQPEEPKKPVTAVTVEETEKTLTVGDTYTIHASVLPEDTTDEKTLVYTSSNEAAVSVDADGVVTAKAEGTAVITVTAFADSSVKAEVFITVNKKDDGEDDKKPDSSALKSALDRAAAKDLSGYTEDSAAAFRTALEEARKALANAEATQTDIDAALKTLNEAEAGLKAKEPSSVTPPDTDNPTPDPANPTPEPNQTVTVGQTFESGNFRYKVTSVNGKTVQVIGLENKKLTAVKIYNTVALAGESYKVTSVASSVFKGNKKIKTAVIGTNVTKLGSNAFAGCTRLTKVTFGKKVTSIGKKAFYGCKKLKTISFKNTKAPKIGKQAFKGIRAKAKITVPKKMAKKQQIALKSRMKKAGAGRKN